MLKRLTLRNFKSWECADLEFGRITGLFGTNSSGKSSLAQFLLLMKQTKESSDRAVTFDLDGRYVELGAPRDVVYGHDTDRDVEFDIRFDSPARFATKHTTRELSKIVPETANGDLARRAVGASIAIDGKGSFGGQTLKYRVGNASFELKRSSTKNGFDLAPDVPGSGFSFQRRKGRPWPLPGPEKAYRFPDEARTYFVNSGFLADLEAAFEDLLDGIYYLGPLREYPKRDYPWIRSRPADVGARGERTIEAIVAADATGERRNIKKHGRRMIFSAIVAHWLKEMKLVRNFEVAEIAPGANLWRVKVKTHVSGYDVMLTDVGFGISQVLPVIVLLYYVPADSTVILEQPEIHLHPSAQAELADAIISVATHPDRRVQVILESHSEHLLLRLQRRISEKNLSSEDVALYFCRAAEQTSVIERLELDEYGRIGNWPENFMGDAFSETAEAEIARLERMRGDGP